MNKNIWIAIGLIAALLMVLPTIQTAFAWYDPSTSEDDGKYELWGPRVDRVMCVIHTGEEAEYNSFKSQAIDLFDWHFTPEQKEELDSIDPDQETYVRVFYVEFGMFEVDINNQVFPGSDPTFRLALSKMIDKDDFISTELSGMGQAAHSPLWHNPGWRNPDCASLESEVYDPSTAYQTLYDAGYRDWDDDGIVEYSSDGGTTVQEFDIVIYGRADDPHRTALAELLNDVLTTGAQDSVIGAQFPVSLNIVEKSICYEKVMVDYNYTLYTGGWSFGRDPDTLYFLYDSAFATKPEPWAINYVNYKNPEFDEAIENMLYASNLDDAHYWCDQAQLIFMTDVAIIPMWNTAGYTGYLSNVKHAVAAAGTGPSTTGSGPWWTLLNGYLDDQPLGGTIRWGWMNDFEAQSVYSSQWVWDWDSLQEIYDTLISSDPYDVSIDLPNMATSWEIGNWTYNGETCTKVTFHLRHDLYWQDLPPKADRLYGIAPRGTGALHVDASGNPDPQPPVPVTAYDVAFTVAYIGASELAWNWGLVSDVVYCDVTDPYTVTVYYGLYLPLWATHWVGGLPIMPKEVWGKVPLEEAGTYDPLGEETLIGSGPFQWNYTAYVPHEYVILDKYDRYFHVSPVDVYVDAVPPTGQTSNCLIDPDSNMSFTVKVHNLYLEDNVTGDLTIMVDGNVIDTISGLTLTPDEEYVTGTYNTGNLPIGSHNITATFHITSPSLLVGLDKTYTHYIWSTIKEDINLDFFVNAKDAVSLGAAFGSKPGDINWDATCDINDDGFVNAKDAVLLGTVFGWPSA